MSKLVNIEKSNKTFITKLCISININQQLVSEVFIDRINDLSWNINQIILSSILKYMDIWNSIFIRKYNKFIK